MTEIREIIGVGPHAPKVAQQQVTGREHGARASLSNNRHVSGRKISTDFCIFKKEPTYEVANLEPDSRLISLAVTGDLADAELFSSSERDDVEKKKHMFLIFL